jgi:hypothetical protein
MLIRKRALLAIAAWLAVTLVILAGWQRQAKQGSGSVLASSAGLRFNLPAVFKPENTPTPVPTNTPVPPTPTNTPQPTATNTPVTPPPTPEPGGNLLVNGGFEGGWTDMPPASGNLINQQPNGWTLYWLPPGSPMWDSPQDIALGVPECLHKPKHTLPPNEWPGAPNALILDGETTYKTFHRGSSFGSQLSQVVPNLPAGRYRLIAPVQLHWQENLDPNDPTWDSLTAESGAWVLVNGQKLGQWVNARQMGDRQWYYHQVEFQLFAPANVEVLLRFKSKYALKDFFVDAVRLEQIP